MNARAHRLSAFAVPLLLAGFALALAACDDPPPPSSTPTGSTPTPPSGVENVDYGVTYCTREDVSLLMDVYYPDVQAEQAPAIVYLHPGSWVLGDKTIAPTIGFDTVLSRGYIVASIDYRLGQDAQFPAQIHDAMCAVRHLRAEHEQYGIDPDRIAAWGASAGGHLASLLGALSAGDDHPFDTGEQYADTSGDVQAVVTMFGPADLEAPDYVPNAGEISEVVFGVDDPGQSASLRDASPVTYVSGGDPPFLIIHGDRDGVVPLAQSQALAMRLEAAAVPYQLLVVQNGDHGFEASADITPPIPEIEQSIANFLDLWLH